MPKKKAKRTLLGMSVLEAARNRYDFLFEEFEHVVVSFSGGKDSTVLLHLAKEAARKAGKLPLNVFFLDWEAQYKVTIDHVTRTLIGDPEIKPWWICLPISTNNCVSYVDPVWTAWNENKKEMWVRPLPAYEGVISDYDYFDFYEYGMSFEDFVVKFADWYARTHNAEKMASVLGLRTQESYSRYLGIRATKNKVKYKGQKWLNYMKANEENVYNAMPIYDWKVEDVWKYISDYQVPYNKIYDTYYQHGLTLSDMRICEPYGYTARRNIHIYHAIEPETWKRMVERVEGCNFAARWGRSEMFDWRKIDKPESYTWKRYVKLLLSVMPPHTRANYERRITVFVEWFRKNLDWEDLLDEDTPKEEASGNGGSWRMVAKTILQNDFWCERLRFKVNKNDFTDFVKLKRELGQ